MWVSGGCLLQGADFPGCLVTVHHRHLTIHEDDVPVTGLFANQFQSLLAVTYQGRVDTQGFENAVDHQLIDRVIFGHDHVQGVALVQHDGGFFSALLGELFVMAGEQAAFEGLTGERRFYQQQVLGQIVAQRFAGGV